jgi:pimeloyl-ACP methyl ester carboxylesterase
MKGLAVWVFLTVLLCITVSCKSQNRSPTAVALSGGETMWITANGLRLKTKIYRSSRSSDHPVLILVLHGDLLAPGEPPTYHYAFARTATERMNDVMAAALLRPGYADDDGDRSEGKQGMRTGDNYTPEVVDGVAQSIRTLQANFHPAATVLVGHSGGAAIAGDLLGRHPSQVNAALMVSCPCDLPVWRKHMMKYYFPKVGPFSLLFLAPVKSLSPIDLAGKVPPSTRVRMVVGDRDPVAPPELTREYAELLRRHGVDAAVTIAPGLTHNILLEPVVFEQLKSLVEVLEKDVVQRTSLKYQ